ncbi:MAG: hypothetical protein ABI658_25075 [Acidimicrobiales bacterium]
MLTTGFKLFFGFFLAAVTAAVLFGYTSGGNHLGPLTAGYKGAVGNQTGYTILLSAGLLALTLAVITISFRDADATAQAQLLGVDTVPAQRPVGASYWPMAAGLAVGAIVVGLVLSSAVFVAGLILLGVVVFEWMIQSWADRATGDPDANRAIRNRVMAPIEVPVLAFAAIAIVILCLSRVFLAVSKDAAVYVAIGVAGVIMLAAIAFSMRPKLTRNMIAAAVVLFGLGIIGAGIVSASVGQREIHHEEHPSAPRIGPPTTAGSGGSVTTEKHG